MGSQTARSREVLLALALGSRRRAERRVLPDRLQSIGSLPEIEWAVLEKTGQISFIKKSVS